MTIISAPRLVMVEPAARRPEGKAYMTFAGDPSAVKIITRAMVSAVMASITQPIARLRVLSRSACKSENIALIPFDSRSRTYLLLTIGALCIGSGVSRTCQVQEELFQRRVLWCHLVDFGSRIDQCGSQFRRPLWRQCYSCRAWAADLR